MAAEPSKWNVAPGANADCNDIPDTVDADSGLASLSAFFPQLTALPLSAGGRAPKREDFNGIFKKIAQWVYFYMQGGVPSWAKAVTYTAGSLTSYGGKTWTALKNSTGVKPAEGAYWHALTYYYSPASLQADLLNKVYPVGSIYMSVVNVSPASFLGGTWQAIEQGRMLMAAGSSWQAGTTGGNAYHTLTIAELPAHNHSATETAAGGHTHGASTGSAGAHSHSGSTNNAGNHCHTGRTDAAGAHAHTRGTMNITGSQAFHGIHTSASVLQGGGSGALYPSSITSGWPKWGVGSGKEGYGQINFDASRSWTGQTSTNGSHSHVFSTSWAGEHAHSLSIASAGAHTHSVAIAAAGAHTHAITIGKTGSGAAFSILPPYVAVYMWRRTA